MSVSFLYSNCREVLTNQSPWSSMAIAVKEKVLWLEILVTYSFLVAALDTFDEQSEGKCSFCFTKSSLLHRQLKNLTSSEARGPDIQSFYSPGIHRISMLGWRIILIVAISLVSCVPKFWFSICLSSRHLMASACPVPHEKPSSPNQMNLRLIFLQIHNSLTFSWGYLEPDNDLVCHKLTSGQRERNQKSYLKPRHYCTESIVPFLHS